MHAFRIGPWAKKKQTAKDHVTFLMRSTDAQRGFVHALASQQLGEAAGALWPEIPSQFHVPADTSTLAYIKHAAKHPSHEFGRLISSHKKASGFISTLGELVGDAASASKGYILKAGKWAIEHGDEIKKGTSIIKNLVQTGTTIGQITGLLGAKKKSQLDDIAAALDKHVQSAYEPVPKKKGGNFRRILV